VSSQVVYLLLQICIVHFDCMITRYSAVYNMPACGTEMLWVILEN